MIKAYCDRCNKEIQAHIDEEYLIDIDVKTTGWVGNRNGDYYSKDFKATKATRKFILCDECLSKFNDIVRDFMELQQKEENKDMTVIRIEPYESLRSADGRYDVCEECAEKVNNFIKRKGLDI